jgi:hypothetical protein
MKVNHALKSIQKKMDLTNQIEKFLPKAMSIHPFDIFSPGEAKVREPRKGYLVFMNDTLSK